MQTLDRRNFLCCVAVAIAAPLCAAETRQEATQTTDLSAFSRVAEAFNRASTLILLEGLPHPDFEAKRFEEERTTKQAAEQHGNWFYERPLQVKGEDVEALRRLCASVESYSTYQGPKRCGRFHADYGLTWQDGQTTWNLLICFSCHEMKMFGPETNLIADIREDAFKQFETLLPKYRDQRPNRSGG